MKKVLQPTSSTASPLQHIYTSILLRVRITDARFTSCLTSSVVSITLSNEIEGAEKGIVLMQAIFWLAWRRKTRRRSILTACSSLRLGRLFNLTFACSWTSVRCLAPARFIICGRHSTSTRMTGVLAEKSSRSKSNTGRSS
jgi:hypothetical protein